MCELKAVLKIHVYQCIVKQYHKAKAHGFPWALWFRIDLRQDHIIPPIPGLAGAAGSGAGMSVMAHSLVRISAAMLAAF